MRLPLSAVVQSQPYGKQVPDKKRDPAVTVNMYIFPTFSNRHSVEYLCVIDPISEMPKIFSPNVSLKTII